MPEREWVWNRNCAKLWVFLERLSRDSELPCWGGILAKHHTKPLEYLKVSASDRGLILLAAFHALYPKHCHKWCFFPLHWPAATLPGKGAGRKNKTYANRELQKTELIKYTLCMHYETHLPAERNASFNFLLRPEPGRTERGREEKEHVTGSSLSLSRAGSDRRVEAKLLVGDKGTWVW